MSQITVPVESESFFTRLWLWLKSVNPIYFVVIVLLMGVAYLNPVFFEPNNFLTFLERSAPLMIMTAGQVYVLVSGGFDLSVGSIATYSVIAAAILANNDPGSTWWVILFILGSGALFGLISGSIVAFLKVPSLITTLGMLLIIRGIGLYWSGGAPRGYLPDNFRALGRGGLEDIFGLREFRLVMHKLNYGKQLFSIGDNPRAARLSGVGVEKVRIAAFIICGTSAALAGIMIGGRGGVSILAGTGLEIQTIAAAVLGGTILLGGRGNIPAAMAGALALELLFTLLNLMGLPKPLRDAVQGLIIIGAVAYIAYSSRRTQ
jgi:ribose transport system permease protein